MGNGNLPLSEALELNTVLDLIQPLIEALTQFISTDHHLQGALQALVIRFGDLHLSPTC